MKLLWQPEIRHIAIIVIMALAMMMDASADTQVKPTRAEQSTTVRLTQTKQGASDLLPLSAVAAERPEVAARLSLLKAQVVNKGVVKVIAGIRTPFTPEASLVANDAMRQLSDIANIVTFRWGPYLAS